MLWRTKNPKAHGGCEVLPDQDSREIQETCADEGCTVVEPVPDGSRCPSCNTIGSKVDLITVKALLKPDALRRLDGQDYRFCAGPDCDVVYFDNAAGSLFQKEDLTVRVGQKEDEDPIPLCYCFEFMLSDIRQELARPRKNRHFCDHRRRSESGPLCLRGQESTGELLFGQRGQGYQACRAGDCFFVSIKQMHL